MDAVSLIEAVEALGARFGIAVASTSATPSSASRDAWPFEAPAAEILLTAHRELEKLVLSARQARVKDSLAGPYGDSCTRASTSTRWCRDIEAFFVSTQQRVTGEVHVLLRPGSLFVEGVPRHTRS